MSDSGSARAARFAVRVLVVAAAGVMAAGFLNWRAGILVSVLATVSYLLLGTAGARLPAPYGRGRLLRSLHRHGYQVVPDGHSRHLVVGPGGVYLLETRVWQHAVSWAGDDWMIGDLPASRAVERLTSQAARLERTLRLCENWPEVGIVPVIAVVGRLPEPVMRAGRSIIARPGSVVGHILAQPAILTGEDVNGIAEQMTAGAT
ncbi:hypothetical protein [Nocardiopsis ansamitocini]|uniref:NERD domain-containing protein n=1 Tax=Nocardiopsis ansamitocini TaxID=1670832 RepID=A0A9W6P4S1_9ACTN|nr:hypothetical protein [Nocardiopsis ansamitocini]GLU47339.1 hypothetical protein Nans01_16900 [Nocardiopsis ansamitocini]